VFFFLFIYVFNYFNFFFFFVFFISVFWFFFMVGWVVFVSSSKFHVNVTLFCEEIIFFGGEGGGCFKFQISCECHKL
jgi:hypothetical protein